MAKKKVLKKKSTKRDITKVYPKREFIKKLRRLADALEQDKQFVIQVAGEQIRIPKHAQINIEHEKGTKEEELEFQIVWEKV